MSIPADAYCSFGPLRISTQHPQLLNQCMVATAMASRRGAVYGFPMQGRTSAGCDDATDCDGKGRVVKKFIVGAMVGAVLILAAALNVHVILLDDGVKLLGKDSMGFHHTFVDARGAKRLKLYTYPDLVSAGIKDAMRD